MNAGIFEKIFKRKELSEFEALRLEFKDKTVLEIGSGQGHYTQIILNQQVQLIIAFDPFVKTTDYIQSKRLDFHQCEINTTQKFDKALCIGVLEFMSDPKDLITKIMSTLKNDSELILVLPNTKKWSYPFYRLYHLVKNGISLTQLNVKEIVSQIQSQWPETLIHVRHFGYLNQVIIAKNRIRT